MRIHGFRGRQFSDKLLMRSLVPGRLMTQGWKIFSGVLLGYHWYHPYISIVYWHVLVYDTNQIVSCRFFKYVFLYVLLGGDCDDTTCTGENLLQFSWRGWWRCACQSATGDDGSCTPRTSKGWDVGGYMAWMGMGMEMAVFCCFRSWGTASFNDLWWMPKIVLLG